MPIINLVYEAPRKWKPNANTIFYFPLEEDAVDVIHNVSLTSSGTTNYTEVGGVKSATFTKSNWLYNDSVSYVPQGDIDKTMSVWVYVKGNNYYWQGLAQVGGTTAGSVFGTGLYYGTSNIMMTRNGSTSGAYSPALNTWLNVIVTYSNSTWKMYVDKELQVTWSNTTAPTSGNGVYLAQNVGSNNPYDTFYGNLSNVILENKARTAEEISNYYNQTKAKYGIS